MSNFKVGDVGLIKEPNTSKLWSDMSPEEKGALLLARHEGKVIEFETYYENGSTSWLPTPFSAPQPNVAYRIRPEPKRETVELWWRKVSDDGCSEGRCGTIDLIDGKPDCESIRTEGL